MWSIGSASVLEVLIFIVAARGLLYAAPNWRNANTRLQQVRTENINGLNERLARKERKLQRNLTVALGWMAFLAGVLMFQPPAAADGNLSPAGWVLTIGLLVAAPYLLVWSRAERNDAEAAWREVMRIADERTKRARQPGGRKEI